MNRVDGNNNNNNNRRKMHQKNSEFHAIPLYTQ